MKELYAKILFYLNKYSRPVLSLLQEGVKRIDIEEVEKSIGLKFPSDFFELYYLNNGTLVKEGDILDDLHFFPGFYFMSLEDAIHDYKILIKADQWNKNWFPIFSNGGGDYFCVDCTEGNKYPIIGFIVGYEDDEMIDYLNLYIMFKTIAECFEKGAYFIEDDYLEIDIEKEKIISRKNNPGLDRWK